MDKETIGAPPDGLMNTSKTMYLNTDVSSSAKFVSMDKETTGAPPDGLTFNIPNPVEADIVDINNEKRSYSRTSLEKPPIDSPPTEQLSNGIHNNLSSSKLRLSSENNDIEMSTLSENGVRQNGVRRNSTENVKSANMRPAHDPHSVSWRWALIILGAGCLLYYLVYLNDNVLPTVIRKADAEENPALFSGERSKESLIKLTNLGPRVVGDIANEEYTPDLIFREVNDAIKNAHFSQKIEIQKRRGSGAYQLGFVPSFTNIYENVQNVMVMVKGSDGQHGILVNCHYDTVPQVDGASDDGISCAVMLELIRVLSKAETQLEHNVVFLFNGAEEVPLQGSHLFLQHEWANNTRIVLNLEAAGAGGRSILFQSGPQNAWIFKYYAKYAPHPHGQVSAEEMFQAGMIPSDTDFRIFRDYGKMPGLDFAFSRNGHVYHTIYDSEEYISAGSHQHMGDNTLALLNSLGNAPELYEMEKHAEGQMVYYDYLGWFMISYSAGGAIALNLITIALAIFSIVIFIGRLLRWSWLPESTPIDGKKFEKLTFGNFMKKFKPESKGNATNPDQSTYVPVDRQMDVDVRSEGTSVSREQDCSVENVVKVDVTVDQPKKPVKLQEPEHNIKTYMAVLIEVAIAVLARIVGMGAAIAVTAIFALIIDAAASLAMPWYSNIWLLFPLYWCPCLVTFELIPHLVDNWRSKKHKLNLSLRTQMNLVAAQIPWIFLFFVMTCAGSRSACIFFLPVLSSAIANLVILLTPLYLSAHSWVWVYLAIHIPSLLMNMNVVLLGYVAFLPVMARSGVINSDLSIAVITSLLCLFLTSFAVPLMTLVRKPRIVFAILTGFSIFMIIVALSSNIGFPYQSGPSDPKVQRYWIMHTLREYRNESQQLRLKESGYFVLNLDKNSPKTIPMKGRSNLRSLGNDCEQEQYCGLPLYMTRMVPLSASSSWIPAELPSQPFTTELHLVSRTCNPSLLECTLNFDLEGPDRMTLTFTPREGASLIEWSVPSGIEPSGEWQGRPSYYLHIVRGVMSASYKITLKFQVTSTQAAGSPVLDIGLAGNHVHHENRRTKAFQDFLDSLPEWTMRTGWISAYKSYVF